ncbi:hypothetical protein ASJ83_07150 [Methanocorpusculum parvum]|uniref:Uncharacterized protein n=1 Tax=Methanocorpusculum parvum TaxID=2193 RepID=A0AAX0QCJ4_9EURY|nr:hypothetical protein ASJ83_07150 [Methanocorpusculum parvum]
MPSIRLRAGVASPHPLIRKKRKETGEYICQLSNSGYYVFCVKFPGSSAFITGHEQKQMSMCRQKGNIRICKLNTRKNRE